MPGKSSKSRTKSMRWPIDLWADIEYEAKRRGVTFNELVVELVREAVPPRPAEEVEGQMDLDLTV